MSSADTNNEIITEISGRILSIKINRPKGCIAANATKHSLLFLGAANRIFHISTNMELKDLSNK